MAFRGMRLFSLFCLINKRNSVTWSSSLIKSVHDNKVSSNSLAHIIKQNVTLYN